MDLPKVERRVPGVPVDLECVELRLPGTFRELCANARYSDEQIGRIVRCIALGTEFFSTPDIESMVFLYRQDQKKRLCAKLRKAKSRRKMSSGGGNDVPANAKSSSGIVTKDEAEASFGVHGDRVSIINAELDKNGQQASSGDSGASGDVIIPEVVPEVAVSAPAVKKADKHGDKFTGDLFASVYSDGGTLDEVMRAKSVASHDTRKDAAWIPGKFNEFWGQYPRKVAKSDALKAFSKLIKAQPDPDKFMSVTLASLAYWKKQEQWTKDKGKFIPYPASWLNAGHWNDRPDDAESNLGQATFLKGDAESNDDLLKRMMGG